ncbi:MAG: insulinase family protein [Aphanothece sp. CMT-3BRIN-NPC111]|nr:insulinase family protein [Aphanothece sp. CMT-3BRIN-NPC111]
MSFRAAWHRYRLPILLFSLCLTAVIIFAGEATSIQPVRPNSSVPAPAGDIKSEKLPVMAATDETSLSLTQNARKTVLENGLTVLTKEVHTAPVVSVQVWYKIGSRNEAPGVNGIAHQLEHMLFKGTKNRPVQFGRLFSALGSESNAFTSYDQTAYYGTVERNKLNALLALEADRMQNALINAEQLTSEKRVVISELQGYENNPNYRLSRAVKRAAFPNQAYGLTVGGTKADVEKFTLEQVLYYYRTYYSPDNATLVITGDFQTEPTLKAVKEIFGKVPKQQKAAGSQEPAVKNQNADLAQNSKPKAQKSPIVLREPGSAALLQAVYPVPNVNSPDVPALDVMDYILTEGRSSRLYQALVESGLASDVGGGAANLIAGGWYELSATAAPGADMAKIDGVLKSAIAELGNKAVTNEELNRAKKQLRATVLLQNRDITSQAMQLGNDQTTAGDYRFTDRYLAGVQEVSAADVQRVAQTYLKEANRTVGFFEPTQPADKGAAGATNNTTQTAESFNLGTPVDPDEVAKYLPKVESNAASTTQSLPVELNLANNLKVLLLPDPSTPTVTLSGYIQSGTEFDPKAKAGLASMTAENLMNGTKTKDALALAKTLEDRGASLDFSANREGVSIGGNTLAADLPTLIQVVADVMKNATFPANELELSRQRALTALKVELDSPSRLARRQFQQQIYPENHPFHAFATEESLKSITRADVVQFYQEHYRPDTTVLTLVGNFEPQQVRSLLEAQFGSWKASGKPPTLKYPSVNLPSKVVKLNPVIPGKTQSVTYIGNKGLERKDPNYYAALVLNEIVGGNTLSSRLGTEIRDREGLTYGIYSYFQAGRYAGPFLIQMQTAPEDATKAIARTIALLQQIRDRGLTPAEVTAAKASITSSYAVSLANPDSVASEILMNEVYGLSKEEIRAFSRKIQTVTPEQVNQAAKELLHPNNLVVVTAGPAVSASR